jgi:hypothetical protein
VGDWSTWEIIREEKGGEGPVEMGEQVAGQNQYREERRKGRATERPLIQ